MTSLFSDHYDAFRRFRDELASYPAQGDEDRDMVRLATAAAETIDFHRDEYDQLTPLSTKTQASALLEAIKPPLDPKKLRRAVLSMAEPPDILRHPGARFFPRRSCMSATTETPRRGFTVFAIPEEAHFTLLQIGHHARLMADLTAIGTQASKHDARLRPDALAWNFSRMAKEIDEILSVSYFSTELVNAYEAAHKERKQRDTKEA